MPACTVASERTRDARTVLIVDDHQLVGASLVLALASRGLTGHVCDVTSVSGVLRVADGLTPGLVLLDLELGAGAAGEPIDELELVAGLRARHWRVLIVSGATNERRVAAAIAEGAVGYVTKVAPLPELLDAVCTAADGGPILTPGARVRWIDIDSKSRAEQRVDRAKLRRLTPKEREVLECLARGERAAAIAERHRVSMTTVRAQIRSIHMKLEVNSQLEAVALVRRL